MTIEQTTKPVSDSKTVTVLDSFMHYVEQGRGSPILFLHGIPTSSYLWRNILPTASSQGRCIALDLIGMGQSGKPDIDYTVFDHIRYVEAFIDALQLKDITLVLHAWGSVIGFDILSRRPELFKGVAFVESQVRPMLDMSMVPLPMQEMLSLAGNLEAAKKIVLESTYFVDKILPAGSLHRFTPEEMAQYRQPFLEPGSRKPLWQFVLDLPKGEAKTPVLDLISRYCEKLQTLSVPKLMIYAVPGYNTSIETVQWASEHFPNLTLVDIEEGFHYPQEYCPKAVADALIKWHEEEVLDQAKRI